MVFLSFYDTKKKRKRKEMQGKFCAFFPLNFPPKYGRIEETNIHQTFYHKLTNISLIILYHVLYINVYVCLKWDSCFIFFLCSSFLLQNTNFLIFLLFFFNLRNEIKEQLSFCPFIFFTFL